MKNIRTGLARVAGAAMVLAGALNGAATSADDLLIKGGKFVDPAAQEIRSENMLIRDGKIIATFKGMPDGLDAEIYDASGKWIIPGLVDMHVHSYGNQGPNRVFDAPGTAGVADRVLYAGVTAFVDLFGDEGTLDGLRQQQAEGTLGGAEVYASLSCLTAPEGHCTEYGVPTRTMSTPEEARATVADLAEKAPDVIKIVYQPTDDQPSIDKPTLIAAIAEAKDHGIKTVVHVKTWQDVRDVMEAGGEAITHVPYADMPVEIPAEMAAAGMAIIPTLALHTDFAAYMYAPEVLENELAQALAPTRLIKAYGDTDLQTRYAERKEAWAERTKGILAKVKAMADAGVTVLAGTDAGNWGTIHGYSLHRELIRMTEAGFTEWHALAAATTDAGAFLGEDFGVSPGDTGSLVILNANPVEDITATQRIEAVIHRGALVDRKAPFAAE